MGPKNWGRGGDKQQRSRLPKRLFAPWYLQNKRMNINKDELKSTSKAIETVHNLCCNENKGASELVAELSTLYQCIR